MAQVLAPELRPGGLVVIAVPSIPAAVVETYTYEPYGQTHIEAADGTTLAESAYGNPFAWTGQRYDSGVGLYLSRRLSVSP